MPDSPSEQLRALAERWREQVYPISAYTQATLAELNTLANAVAALEAENERLRNGEPDRETVRFGPVEAEPWEGNGPCMDCEGRSPYWHVPNRLWDAVMGDGERAPGGLICPVCFTIRAWRKAVEGWDGQWWWTPHDPGVYTVPLDDFIYQGEHLHAAEADIERVRKVYRRLFGDAVADAASPATNEGSAVQALDDEGGS
jgi:hypothetical protein